MTVYTLFGQPASPATVAADVGPYTMGVQFSVSVSGGTLTAIWFYSGPSASSLPSQIALYQVSGASLVVSQAPSWSGAAASGWIRAPFTSPPVLTSGTSYKAAVVDVGGADFWYAATANYWDTGAGGSGITNGVLSAPNNAGGDGGQDTFFNSSTQGYPATSFNAANYWVDPEVTATASGTNANAAVAAATGVPPGDTADALRIGMTIRGS